MSPLDHSSPLSDHHRVRIAWDEFEKWAQGQRKFLERRKADIIYAQRQRMKSSSRERNHADDEGDKIAEQQLEAAVEDHTNMLLNEWHRRREEERLGYDAWGTRTEEEAERIARLFQTEDAIDRFPPPFQNVYAQSQTAPVYNSAPPMTSAARQRNYSASTSSSRSMYVDISSLATDDDEGYDGEDSFHMTTDGSESDFWVPSKLHGLRSKSSTHSSQNGSPDHLSSSGSSGYEILQLPPLSSSSVVETHMEPPKRPPDIERKGKARARGPAYVGPHLLSPEDSSDEDDFTAFRMQARIDKIWEFHLAAARADVDLAIAIQNKLMSRDSSWDDSEYETRISEHQKRMERLRDEKERERQELVDVERRKRKEEIGRRSAARGARTTNTHTQRDWESLFQASPPVHLDIETRALALGSPSSLDESQTKNAFYSASHIHVPATVPSNNSGTVRARRQSQTNVPSSSSGWKAKHNPSALTTAFAQAQAPTSSDSRSWFDPSHEVNDESFDLDGITAQDSPPLPPIPAGWGEKSWSEKPSATSLLKKVLSDPPRKHSSVSSSVEPVKTFNGRQTGLGHFDHDAAEFPTTPIVDNARRLPGVLLPRDIRQPLHAYHQTDDEMSLTPRPGLTSTSTSWKTNEQDVLSRQGKVPPRRLQFDDDDGYPQALADKTMMSQENPQWDMVMRQQRMREGTTWDRGLQGGSAAPASKQSPPGSELSPWQQQQQKMKSRVQPSAFPERVQPSTFGNVPKAEDVQEDFWAAARAKLTAGANQSVVDHHSEPEETPWQRMERLKAEKVERSLPSSAGPSMNPFDQPPARKGLHSSKPSWSGAPNFEHPKPDVVPQTPSAPAQSSNKYWTPNGSNTSHKLNGNAQSTAKISMTMPGGYLSDTQYDRFSSANGGSSQVKARMRSSYIKHPTVEEEPDEDGPDGRDAQVGALPYNSRFILDVAVPKPIHPPEAYSDVIDYGEDLDEENGWDNSLSSPAQTPSTAPTSPPDDGPSMTEEWMNKVTENLKNGKFEDMDLDFGSFDADISNRKKPVSALSYGTSTTQSARGAQKPDTVKIQSTTQSAPTSSISPPKATPASESSVPVSSKATPAAKTAAAPEKPEPAVKTGNQNQKGKKGKGKGRK